MSATLAPYGLRPVYHPSGQDRALAAYKIPVAYATALYRGTPVTLNTGSNLINVAVNTPADWLGVFWGCEFIDAFGVPQESSYWPASQAVLSGTVPVLYIYDKIETVYEIQADGSIADTQTTSAIGQQLNFSSTTGYTVSDGNVTLGQSTCAAGAASMAQSGTLMMRIVDIAREIDNVQGDTYTKILVENARSQFRASKAAV